MDLGLAGKRALVTGASEGVGRATVLVLAEEGCDVAFCARRAEPLEELAAEVRDRYGRRAVPVPTDLTQLDEIVALVARASAELGGLDILVNNAGSSALGFFEEISDDQFVADVEMKLFGYIRTARAALPHLAADGGGVVINVAGNTGKFGYARSIAGGIANAGVMNFSTSFAELAAPRGVRVMCLAPGSVDTQRFQTQVVPTYARERSLSMEEARQVAIDSQPLKRIPSPEEAAGVIAFLASPRAANVHGTTLIYDGGHTRGI